MRWSVTGKPTRPRPIVVRFLRFKDKKAVLERAKNLRGKYIFLNKDYPEAVVQKRKEPIPAMKAARERRDIAYICYARHIIHRPSQKPGRDVYFFNIYLFALFNIVSISDKLPRKRLKIAHFTICSLRNKVNEINNLLTSNNNHIQCI